MLLRFIKFHFWPVMMMALFYFVLKTYRRHLASLCELAAATKRHLLVGLSFIATKLCQSETCTTNICKEVCSQAV